MVKSWFGPKSDIKKQMESFKWSDMFLKDSLLLWLQIFGCVLSYVYSPFLLFLGFYLNRFIFLFSFLNSANSLIFALSYPFLETLLWGFCFKAWFLWSCVWISMHIHPLLSWDNFFQIYLLTVFCSVYSVLLYSCSSPVLYPFKFLDIFEEYGSL